MTQSALVNPQIAREEVVASSLLSAQAASNPDSTSASATAKLVASDQTQGPFPLGDRSFTFVKHLQSVEGSKPEDSTVEWWELRDEQGRAVYRQQYSIAFQGATFEDTEEVGAQELKGKFGQGILISGQSLPSAPNTGWWVQPFALVNGKLTPLSAPISGDGDYVGLDVDSYQPSPMFRGQQTQTVSRDVLRFREWTGYFSILYDLEIDWTQGKLRPAWTCMQMTSKGRSSACSYKVEAEPVPRKDLTFVRLFSEPEDGFTPTHMVIKPESKVEFVEAQMFVPWNEGANSANFEVSNSEKIWLHIRVDEHDGWISGEEDFEAVGLLPAD